MPLPPQLARRVGRKCLVRVLSGPWLRDRAAFIGESEMTIQIVVPYGNAYGSNHMAVQGGEKTFCGRNRYGWSVCREFEDSDMDSAYTCKRCVAAAVRPSK